MFKGGEIDSETYYSPSPTQGHPSATRTEYHRNVQPNRFASGDMNYSNENPRSRPDSNTFMKRRLSPDANYSSILKENTKTPPGYVRKDPPITPPGYKRIEEGPNFGKIKPDSNPPTPSGFMKARQPQHFTFDKNAPPTTASTGQSQMTPRTMVSTVVEQLGAKFSLRSRTPEKERTNNQREQSRSPVRNYDRNRDTRNNDR